MRTILATLGITGIVTAILGLLVVYTGLFNVATGWKHSAPVHWVLMTARINSIKVHAASIDAPEPKGEQQIDAGFRSYREMCAICHTPPGAKDSPVTKGLNPVPPDLAKSSENMSSAEIFWTIKNGIRMTGMPAWGPTHKDNEMWDIVAFVNKLPKLSKEDYLAMDARLEKGHDHSGGGHDEDSESNEKHANKDDGHDDGGDDDHGHDKPHSH
ncbi:MAG: cytochrome c [Thiohalomonadales bacterium]